MDGPAMLAAKRSAGVAPNRWILGNPLQKARVEIQGSIYYKLTKTGKSIAP